ncbi:MAG: DUF4438 domain-containing protein [Bdellovibrionota bacterium]
MLKTNEKHIVEMVLQCSPCYPKKSRMVSVAGHAGKPFNLPGIGGITLNIEVGDSAFGWEGDHLEPGVSCTANAEKPGEFPNPSLQYYSCVGNKVKVISGKAKGAEGVIIGHHGGAEDLIVDFSRKAKEKMTYDDKMVIFSKGQGLKLVDFQEIKLMSVSPDLLNKMKIKTLPGGKLRIPVTTIIPAECMGSGLGSIDAYTGDYDVMTSDHGLVKKHNLDEMRFGDFVAIMDHDNSFGPAIKKGAITIGIVIHSDCLFAGHGPGVTVLFTCAKPLIEPVLDKNANIGALYKIGRFKR